jgi:hypothetical protein
MPAKHHDHRRVRSPSSMHSKMSGTHAIAARLVAWPAAMRRKCGAQNMTSAADTNAANGCRPRRVPQTNMKAPSSQTSNAMVQLVADSRGRSM